MTRFEALELSLEVIRCATYKKREVKTLPPRRDSGSCNPSSLLEGRLWYGADVRDLRRLAWVFSWILVSRSNAGAVVAASSPVLRRASSEDGVLPKRRRQGTYWELSLSRFMRRFGRSRKLRVHSRHGDSETHSGPGAHRELRLLVRSGRGSRLSNGPEGRSSPLFPPSPRKCFPPPGGAPPRRGCGLTRKGPAVPSGRPPGGLPAPGGSLSRPGEIVPVQTQGRATSSGR